MLIKGEQGEEAYISKSIMKILTSDSRGENCSYFSSYERQTQSWFSRENSGDLTHKGPRRLCRSYSWHTGKPISYRHGLLTEHSTSRDARRSCVMAVSQCFSWLHTWCPEGEAGSVRKPGSCHLPPLTGHHHSLFHYPSHKIRIAISPLNTFSPFDGTCYTYIIIAGY